MTFNNFYHLLHWKPPQGALQGSTSVEIYAGVCVKRHDEALLTCSEVSHPDLSKCSWAAAEQHLTVQKLKNPNRYNPLCNRKQQIHTERW